MLYRFVVQKHLHGFVHDTGGEASGGGAGAEGDSQRRGNLDIVGLQFDGKQRERKLAPAASAQVSRLIPSAFPRLQLSLALVAVILSSDRERFCA